MAPNHLSRDFVPIDMEAGHVGLGSCPVDRVVKSQNGTRAEYYRGLGEVDGSVVSGCNNSASTSTRRNAFINQSPARPCTCATALAEN
jgi:hypothetical protein